VVICCNLHHATVARLSVPTHLGLSQVAIVKATTDRGGEQMSRKITVAIIIAAVLITSANTCAPGTTNVPAQKLLDLINQKRAAAGCSPVTGDDKLRAAAERHAVDMRDHPNVRVDPNHIGSDGSSIGSRISDAGFTPASLTGEIMYFALGPPGNNEQANIDWWMGSAPHRQIIQNCAFTHAGVGLLYPGGTQWFSTVDFGRH
jgi:uncharacterized protein YkwD